MWNRACPLCFARVPRELTLSRSEDLSCPSCRASLELSRPSRVLDASVGLLAAFATASAVFRGSLPGAWAVGPLAAVLAFGAASALAVFFLPDLVVRPKEAGSFPHRRG
jgi:hypothetical protein